MIYIQFFIGMILHCLLAYTSYSASIKANTALYFTIALLGSLTTSMIWFWIARVEQNSGALLLKGVYWDAMIVGAYIGVPMLIFQAHKTLSTGQLVGVLLMAVGLLLTKVG